MTALATTAAAITCHGSGDLAGSTRLLLGAGACKAGGFCSQSEFDRDPLLPPLKAYSRHHPKARGEPCADILIPVNVPESDTSYTQHCSSRLREG